MAASSEHPERTKSQASSGGNKNTETAKSAKKPISGGTKNTKSSKKADEKGTESQPENIVIHRGEVKDSKQIFEMAWKNLVDKFGNENMNFPKEIFFLAGAPGAGKGLMTNFIKKVRGISTETIETSHLLNSPEAEQVKARGGLVASRHVVQFVFQKLLEKQFRQGVVVDGFPRTLEQGECIKLLHDKMVEYKDKYQNSKHSSKFSRPMFSITVLFIEEEVSIARQLSRGEEVRLHNRRVRETNIGSPRSVRRTDSDEQLARERYRQFKDHIIPSLNGLKKYFNFHFVLADAEPEVVKARLLRELQYQSSTELQEATFDLVQTVPLASQILLDARVKLVRRLDEYVLNHRILFEKVLKIISKEFLSIIKYNVLSGKVIVRSENEVFKERKALRMTMDVLTERGFNVCLDVQRQNIPDRVVNGQILNRIKFVYHFTVLFKKPNIRNTNRFLF